MFFMKLATWYAFDFIGIFWRLLPKVFYVLLLNEFMVLKLDSNCEIGICQLSIMAFWQLVLVVFSIVGFYTNIVYLQGDIVNGDSAIEKGFLDANLSLCDSV